jgi:DNA repair photolyase
MLVDCVQQCCYCRERKYCPHEHPNDFAYVIDVKENAPELLRRILHPADPSDSVRATIRQMPPYLFPAEML